MSDWKRTPEHSFHPWPSDDKLGQTCSVSAETVARLAAALQAPGGWMMTHNTHFYQSFVYSAPERLAAHVVMDR